MSQTLQVFATIVQAIALLVGIASFSSFFEDKGHAARALEEAARADVSDVVGRVHFEQAEQEEHTADAAATGDAVTFGLATISLLLASGVWLLASIARSLTVIERRALVEPENNNGQVVENISVAA